MKIIEENINKKKSYGKNRSIQIKVSMSDEEVHLIDWLGKQVMAMKINSAKQRYFKASR